MEDGFLVRKNPVEKVFPLTTPHREHGGISISFNTRPAFTLTFLVYSRLEPMKKFCGTLRNHWEEILHYFEHPYTNAIPEGLNSLIQNIKRRARGFRNDEYFKTMIYLGCGKLKFDSSFP